MRHAKHLQDFHARLLDEFLNEYVRDCCATEASYIHFDLIAHKVLKVTDEVVLDRVTLEVCVALAVSSDESCL